MKKRLSNTVPIVRHIGLITRTVALLALLSFSVSSTAQVTGTVTDETGEALIGVNIVEKGTSNGTQTDIDGTYSITLSGASTMLIFSYVGYDDIEVETAGKSVVDLRMNADAEVLDEVVVVGYGTQRRVDLTGAVGSVGAEQIEGQAILTADQALRGRVAGVQLTNRSGDPGAPINVRIRGVGTTGTNKPLWVVDGVPIVQTSNITVNTASNTESNPLVGINPSDIESIDVLKDASAAAIYGARAANGVIIVTTKRGKEGRTALSYDGYYGTQNVRKKHDVLGVADYVALQNELGNTVPSALASQPFVDWQDEVFKSAPMQSHNLSATGGNEMMNFNISAGYFKQEGISLATEFERYSVKANSDIKIGKKFKVGESLNISFSDRLVESEPGRAAGFNGAQNSPYTPVYENGAFTVFNAANSGPAAASNNQTVGLNDLSNNETRVKSRRILGSIYGEYELAKNLKYKFQAGLDYTIGEGSWLQGIYNFGSTTNTGILQVVSKPTEQTTNITNTLTYTPDLGEKHNLTVLLGHEETNFEFDRLRGQGRGFLSPAVTLVNTAATSAVGQEKDNWALRGFLGRINYTFDNKYLLTINARQDITSRFAEGNRSATFPSVSVGWRVSQEDFMKNNSGIIDDLKIRASWGQSGNQFTSGSFGYLNLLGLTSLYVIGSGQTIVPAPAPFTLANAALKWEVSTQVDIGADLRLWGGKFDFSVDYFQKTTDDILLLQPISAVSGSLQGAEVNSGKVQNKGIELTALYQDRAGDVGYSISANLTSVKNEVLSLGKNDLPIITGYGGAQTHRTSVGESIGHFFGYKTDGIFQTQAEVDAAAPEPGRTPRVGDIRFADINNDGMVTPADRTILGESSPNLFYGINLGADYKGFDVNLFFQGVSGVSVLNNVRRQLETMNSSSNQSASVVNRWTGEGTSTTIPQASTNPNGNDRIDSDRWVENASYFRFQNFQIGYTIPSSKISDISNGHISNVRLYFSMQNLFTITDYTGLDPEVTRGFSFQKGEMPLATGQDDGSTPSPRIVQFGARVTF